MFQNNKLFLLLLVGFYSVFGYLWWTWTYFLGETPYYSEAIPEKGFFHYLVAYCASWAILLLFPPILGRAFGRLLKKMGAKDNFHRLLPILNVASSVWVLLSIFGFFLFLVKGRESLSTGWSLMPPSFVFLTYGIMVGMDPSLVWWDFPSTPEVLEKRVKFFGKEHVRMITYSFIAAYLQIFFSSFYRWYDRFVRCFTHNGSFYDS